jgi:hypothetical protein
MASAKDNLTPELIQEIIPSIILPTVAVVLRFWSRWVNRPKGNMPMFWWDDWLCLASLVNRPCLSLFLTSANIF